MGRSVFGAATVSRTCWLNTSFGAVAGETDAEGRTTTLIDDALERLVRIELPGDRTLLHTYDAAANVLTETDPRFSSSQAEIRNKMCWISY